MSVLYLVRHGQASFGKDNYDRLSPTGVRQAKILAKHFARTGKIFDAIYSGQMERQLKTAQELIDFYTKNQMAVTQPVISSVFNEYDSLTVWETQIPLMLEEDPSLSQDLERVPEDGKAFQRIFSKVIFRWISGAYDRPGVPRWRDFKHCIRKGLEEIMVQYGSKKQLVIFTSGGFISVVMQTALGLSDKKAVEISWQIMNASVTRFKYNSQGIVLTGFNEVTHLEMENDIELLTYR